jgi:uncharacterized protein
MKVTRPTWLFDREAEWERLVRFDDPTRVGSRLGVVLGRRRQGKTALLEAFAEASGGFYWQAVEESSAQNLRDFSIAWHAHIGASSTAVFPDWSAAIAALFGEQSPGLAVIDEFGYLLGVAPEVASLLQARLTPRAQRTGHTRLILCGSAFSQMKAMLSGTAALRGRVEVELVIGPFDYRTAAAYWQLSDNVDAAFQTHALVGGAPAHLVLAGGRPTGGNVERWMIERLFDPTSPLFREGRVVVTEDPSLNDRALYWGLLSALAEGGRRKADLAQALDRTPTSLAFPMRVLIEGGWAEAEPDPFHPNRSILRLTEPIIRTYRLLIQPEERRLVRGDATRVARDARPIIARQINGPHLEWMAAEWALRFAGEDSVGGSPRYVTSGNLADRGASHQLDLVAVERAANGGDRIHAIGEVKAGQTRVGVGELERLDGIVPLLKARAAKSVQRILVSRSGFTTELERAAARRHDITLVDLHRLYHGT